MTSKSDSADDNGARKKQRLDESGGISGGVMLVTGASSGVGAAIVKHYASLGWKVAAIARRKELLLQVCQTAGSNATAFECDVADRSQVAACVRDAVEKLGPIDVLVNNAAVGHDGRPFWELEVDDIDRVLDVNLKGSMYVTHAVLKGMVSANRGRIFAIASVAGTWGIPNESCYVASKHGMVGFMDTLANETRSTGVVVSTICPGGIDTPWWTKEHPYGGDKSHSAGETGMLIQPEEIIDLMDYQLKLPANRVLKRVVFFPKGEWH
uniref:Ketoacyl-reductase like protein n=1 Tax=Karlodinium veneficum TaxID=407301 RepID=B8XIJ9_KARVE|nr:ketoacyl-reductase like protein [Karlodinium veneficum]